MTGDQDRCAIIGCGSEKLDLEGKGPVFIGRLYTSTYFQKKLAYAKECCDRYYILSAKHGLVASDYMVEESYDLSIDDLDDNALEEWADDVADRIRWFESSTTIVMLAGQQYIDPIRTSLEQCPAEVEYPFAETDGIGEQLQWLTEEIETARADTPVADPTDDQAGLGRWT